jgi:hypothetical protein
LIGGLHFVRLSALHLPFYDPVRNEAVFVGLFADLDDAAGAG